MTRDDDDRSNDEQDDKREALATLRRELDGVDRGILEGLARRADVVARVGALKSGGGTVVRDSSREEALLGRLVDLGRTLGLDALLVTRVFREVLDHSLRVQHERLARDPARARTKLSVGYQGGEGAFSQLCAQRHFATRDVEVVYRGFSGFRPMLDALREHKLDYAVLPIENTTAGSINESYDLLAEMDLHLVGEEAWKVEHCLIGFEDADVDAIERVFSHPVALAQCGRLLSELGCKAEAFEDTALAVAKVKAEGDRRQAAIASDAAARIHGLSVLRHAVQDQRSNYTRMVIVSREPAHFDVRIPCKTSLIFATHHREGALARAIAVLAEHGLNLTKLESRPRPNNPWEYRFYLDFEGNLDDPVVRDALEELARETSYLRILGTYPTRTSDAAKPATPRRKRIDAAPSAGVMRIGALDFGARPLVFAGPMTASDSEGIGATLHNAGVDALWGAHLDERDEALRQALVRAAGTHHLPLVLGLRHRADIAMVRDADLLVVSMDDTELLDEIGRLDVGIVLQRGLSATTDAWLAAADRVRKRGNARIVLLDAGVQLLDRRAPDLAALPDLDTPYPVVVDVGEASTRSIALARAAVSAGARGVVVRAGDALETLTATLRP